MAETVSGVPGLISSAAMTGQVMASMIAAASKCFIVSLQWRGMHRDRHRAALSECVALCGTATDRITPGSVPRTRCTYSLGAFSLLSRCCPAAGLVFLCQTFVRRSQWQLTLPGDQK